MVVWCLILVTGWWLALQQSAFANESEHLSSEASLQAPGSGWLFPDTSLRADLEPGVGVDAVDSVVDEAELLRQSFVRTTAHVYTMTYDWAGNPAVGFAGWGAEKTDPDWYTVDLSGSTVRGIRISPVGGKIYQARVDEPNPQSGKAVFGAPGVEIGDGRYGTRVRKARFTHVFHRNDSHFQTLRTALYGDNDGFIKDSIGKGDVIKDGFTEAEDTVREKKGTLTAQLWLHTTPDGMMPSRVFIPTPNTTYAQAGKAEFTIIDNERPATEFGGTFAKDAGKWVQARTAITLIATGYDRGSGVRRLQLHTSRDGTTFRRLQDSLVVCDFLHQRKSWQNVECPHQAAIQQTFDPEQISEGKTTFRMTATDRAGIESPLETASLFVDRRGPIVGDAVVLGGAVRQLQGWTKLEKPLRLSFPVTDALSGVANVELVGKQGILKRSFSKQTICDSETVTGGKSCPRERTAVFVLEKSGLPKGVEGVFDLELQVTDAAGNVTTTPVGTLSLDRQLPSPPAHLTLTPDLTKMRVGWGSSIDRDPGSGVDTYVYRYQVNGGVFTNWREKKTVSTEINNLQSNDLLRFEVFARDRAGNVSETVSIEGRTKRIPAKTPFAKPCTRKPCRSQPQPKPPCKTNKNTKRCTHTKRPRNPKRKKRKRSFPVELKPCMQPRSRSATELCMLNLYVRGIDLAQGPTGRVLVEQDQPYRQDLLRIPYQENALSDFYQIEKEKVEEDFVYKPVSSYRAATRLIAGKGTLARVYTAFTGVNAAPKAQVILTGLTRNSEGKLIELGEFRSQLHPVRTAATRLQTLREDPNQQATFPLPPEWTTPETNLILHARVIGQPGMRECETCKDQANDIELHDITFTQPTPGRTPNGNPTTQAPIILHRILWDGNPRVPTDQEIEQSVNIMRALYPLARDQINIETDKIDRTITGVPLDSTGAISCGTLLELYKNQVPKLFELTELAKQNKVSTRHFGVIQPNAKLTGNCRGIADLGGLFGIAKVGPELATLAHEVGHNYGRPHAGSNNGEAGAEPWPDGLTKGSNQGLGSINGLWFWRPGLGRSSLPVEDLGRLTTFSVHNSDDFKGDLMSYNDKTGSDLSDEPGRVTSPNTWNALLDGFNEHPSCNSSECEQPVTPSPPQTTHQKHLPIRILADSTPGSELIIDPAQPHDRTLFFIIGVKNGLLRSSNESFGPFIESFGDPDPPYYDPFNNRYFLEPKPGWHFVAYDVDNNIVLDLPAGAGRYSDGSLAVSTTLRLPAKAVKLQFKANDQVLLEQNINPHPPTVRIIEPKAGERWWYDPKTKTIHSSTGKTPRILWETEDLDGDKVTVYQGYSPAPGFYEPGGWNPGSYVPGSENFVIPGVGGMTPSQKGEGRVALKFSDGWYSGMILGPKITVEPRQFGSDDVKIAGPGLYTSRFSPMSFYAQARDPNTGVDLEDEYTKPSPYAWYYKGKLLSRKNEFSTTRFSCARKPVHTVTLVIKGSYGAVFKKRITTRLTPKKIPRELKPLCKKRKKKQK